MPYELWRMEQSKGAPCTAQAFVFDGWSHEPLVIEQRQDAQVAPKHDMPAVAVTRSAAKVG